MAKLFKTISTSPKLLDVDYSVSLNQYKNDVNKCIDFFINVMNKKSPGYCLDYFYNNIKELKIYYIFLKKDSKTLAPTSALYNSRDNIISIEENFNSKVLFHELFHVSSAIKNNKKSVLCGFKQFKNYYEFGRGLNEGYTELLSERYFNTDSTIISYPYEVNILKHLENFIGREKMESYYSNANLYGLILDLNKYMNEEEIGNFISNLDFLNEKIYNKNNSQYTLKKLTKIISKIYEFIIDCNLRQLREQINLNLISFDNAKEKIYSIINSIETIYPDNNIFSYKNSFYIENELKTEKNVKIKQKLLNK